MGLIGILAGLLFPAVNGAIDSARSGAPSARVNTVITA
jgi:hypothetical protein